VCSFQNALISKCRRFEPRPTDKPPLDGEKGATLDFTPNNIGVTMFELERLLVEQHCRLSDEAGRSRDPDSVSGPGALK
jgi:hypothetical protein